MYDFVKMSKDILSSTISTRRGDVGDGNSPKPNVSGMISAASVSNSCKNPCSLTVPRVGIELVTFRFRVQR